MRNINFVPKILQQKISVSSLSPTACLLPSCKVASGGSLLSVVPCGEASLRCALWGSLRGGFASLRSLLSPAGRLRFAALSVVCGLILCGCITTEYNVATRKQDIFIYSTEREVAIGQNIARKIAKEFKISKSPHDIQRVNEIVNKTLKFVDRQEISYYFYIIEEDDEDEGQLNAFSLPGGYVYIYKELLDLLSDDELAFVLAHEVGHIVSRHQIKRLQAAMGYNLVMVASIGAKASPEFTQGLSFALIQILMGYSQEDEFNADELAVKYCQLAGFEPTAGIKLQEKLYEENKKKIRPLSYFRTHPYTSQRIRHIKETLRLPLDVDDYINY